MPATDLQRFTDEKPDSPLSRIADPLEVCDLPFAH